MTSQTRSDQPKGIFDAYLLFKFGGKRFLYLLQLLLRVGSIHSYRGKCSLHCLHELWGILVERLRIGILQCLAHGREPRCFGNEFGIAK
jgi:hypothetical protein